ncbi:hypothetical protein IFM89_034968 [Coptis chinensis]|uniref:Peptidase M16 N-terminal domain-containing protein n=1 Tax=Coptis chinensis TaxID=261450 RepID=A0A835LY18_9MAGN|nr:hypothetical protein IFM89_034968 [Coptis chinensis]
MSEQVINECKSKAVLFRHKKTGCEVMSVSNDDENKVFGIVFRTPPKDSTGIPHILEHSVLCGSRKYPLKEPFIELLKGSLNTFLNAFTYPDRTCYPVASTNTKALFPDNTYVVDSGGDPNVIPKLTFEEFQLHELRDCDFCFTLLLLLQIAGVILGWPFSVKGCSSGYILLFEEKFQQSVPVSCYYFCRLKEIRRKERLRLPSPKAPRRDFTCDQISGQP